MPAAKLYTCSSVQVKCMLSVAILFLGALMITTQQANNQCWRHLHTVVYFRKET
jgi:hypothetical protein